MDRKDIGIALTILLAVFLALIVVFIIEESRENRVAKQWSAAEQFANTKEEKLVDVNLVCESKFQQCNLFIKTNANIYKCADNTTRFCVKWEG